MSTHTRWNAPHYTSPGEPNRNLVTNEQTDKSGVRFAPKVRQRRSVTGTPTESRRSSVTPSLAESQAAVSDDETQEAEDRGQHDPISTIAVESMGAPSVSRRSSVVEPTLPATKQRRLSTLSNTQRAGDFLRKNSISEPTKGSSHVIGIPFPPTQATKRRRSSVARTLPLKRRSASIDPNPVTTVLPTPPSTQDRAVQPEHQEMTKAQAKAPESPIQEENEQDETKQQVIALDTTTDSSGMKEGIRRIKRAYDDVEILKKVMYDPLDITDSDTIISVDHRISAFDQITKSIYSLSPALAAKISIDEETFTMEDLCKPSLPIGKTSSHFEMAQSARRNQMAERARKRQIRNEARRLKRSIESFEEDSKDKMKKEMKLMDEEEYETAPAANAAIQLKLKNGQLIVDEESTVVDRHKNAEHSHMERQDENPFENVVNSATYGRQRYTDKWASEEVAKFYRALGQWGTDFALIAQMFPHRTRKQIKSKFILEEKRRPRLIELALSNKLGTEFDFDAYCSDSNKTFATLNEFNAKLDKLKVEHEDNLKELSAAKEKAKEEDTQKQKKREMEIQTGQRTMTRQERISELTKHETVLGSIDEMKKQRHEETSV